MNNLKWICLLWSATDTFPIVQKAIIAAVRMPFHSSPKFFVFYSTMVGVHEGVCLLKQYPVVHIYPFRNSFVFNFGVCRINIHQYYSVAHNLPACRSEGTTQLYRTPMPTATLAPVCERWPLCGVWTKNNNNILFLLFAAAYLRKLLNLFWNYLRALWTTMRMEIQSLSQSNEQLLRCMLWCCDRNLHFVRKIIREYIGQQADNKEKNE